MSIILRFYFVMHSITGSCLYTTFNSLLSELWITHPIICNNLEIILRFQLRIKNKKSTCKISWAKWNKCLKNMSRVTNWIECQGVQEIIKDLSWEISYFILNGILGYWCICLDFMEFFFIVYVWGFHWQLSGGTYIFWKKISFTCYKVFPCIIWSLYLYC